MYKVVCDYSTLYVGSLKSLKINDTKLEMELGKAGSFEFTIYPKHPHYDSIERMKSIITVYDDSDIIFRGRDLNEDIGTEGEKHVTCEGDLSFLVDTIIVPHTYNGTLSGYFSYILELHNVRQSGYSSRTFTVGDYTAAEYTISITKTEYRSTLDILNKYIVQPTGGVLSVRYYGAIKYLDCLDPEMDAQNVSNQDIRFGENLVNIRQEARSEDVFSYIIPLGAKIEGSENRLTVASVNGGSIYLYNSVAVQKYGKIFKTVIFDEITDASTLLSQGMQYLANNYDSSYGIEVVAADLSYIKSVDSFKLGQYVNVVSAFHGISQTFIIKKLSIDLLNPASNRITVGKIQKGITDLVGGSESSATSQVEQPYLIDSGTSGIWTWAKYSDGTAECFGKINVAGASTGTAPRSWYRTASLYDATSYAYPVTFSEAPATTIQFHTRNEQGALIWSFSTSADNQRQYLPQCYLIRPTQA